MGTIIGWLSVGAIAGGMASLIVPGRTPGGAIGAVIVGIIGGFLGGFLLSLFFGRGPASFIGSLIVAISGAVIVLYALRAAQSRSARSRTTATQHTGGTKRGAG